MQTLRNTIDQLKQNLTNAVILLATVADGKIQLAAGISKELTAKFHAGKLMQHITSQLGGKGGGRPDMAQGGGTNIDALDPVLDSVVDWVKASHN
jgi:alanyl-tRNA synthetase